MSKQQVKKGSSTSVYSIEEKLAQTAGGAKRSRYKKPTRAPGKARVERIIESTIDLLRQHSVDQITISMIALEANMTRTSIYEFFPTITSIYSEIAKRYTSELAESVNSFVAFKAPETLGEIVDSFIDGMAEYFNSHVPIMKVYLGESTVFGLPAVVENYDVTSAAMYHRFYNATWDIKPLSEEDPFRTLVLLQTALLTAGFRRHGEIASVMVEEIKLVAHAYLAQYSNDIVRLRDRRQVVRDTATLRLENESGDRKQLQKKLCDLTASMDDRTLEVAVAQVEVLARLSR